MDHQTGTADPLDRRSSTGPVIVDLHDQTARSRELTGGKAAVLAQAMAGGSPVIPGFVLTVCGTARVDAEGIDAVADDLAQAWTELGGDGTAAVVRSSSVVEDSDEESMAGQYETVSDVASLEELREAVHTVMASRSQAAATQESLSEHHPIAVLVQRQITPDWGGVAFGVDPVTGRPDRRTIAVSQGAPEGLVSGTTDGDTWVLDTDGSVVSRPEDPEVTVDEDVLHQVVTMVDGLGEVFGSPQDVEWAADADGSLWLLQSRPVTTTITGTPTGPELGTGPIAETFPDAMSALEEDLWVPPLREALTHALQIAAIAGSRDVERSPVLLTIDGRPAVDLEIFGRSERNKSPIRDRIRRIMASWRLGRLRGALPLAARRVVTRTDAELAEIPPLGELADEALLGLLTRAQDVLRSLHGHEVLIGLISDPDGEVLTGSGIALRLLGAAQREGLDDAEAIARHPAILALSAPRIARRPELPTITDVPDRPGSAPPPDDPGVLREALRMRVRWVQELTVRVAEALGDRLAEQGLLSDPAEVRHVRLEDLRQAIESDDAPALQEPPVDEPLPTRFRLSEDGAVVPAADRGDGDGVGAGGGSGTGPVHVLEDEADLSSVPEGAVLVVGQLAPQLATVLDRLEGLVAETGSPLSHVAILARESGVATVVSLHGARDRLSAGQEVHVDGTAGTVTGGDA